MLAIIYDQQELFIFEVQGECVEQGLVGFFKQAQCSCDDMRHKRSIMQ